MKVAYLQCIGGISGDMLLGAIIDAGLPVGNINESLAKLGVEGLRISHDSGKRGGVNGTNVTVHASDITSENSWTFEKFINVTQQSSLGPNIIKQSCRIFQRLSEAESSVHKIAPDESPHLSELGDVDTLADVVGSVVGFDSLGVDRIYSSPLPSGRGIANSQHGKIPALAPATATILAMGNAPIVASSSNVFDTGEMVTPTGAAIVTILAMFNQPHMDLNTIGYGLGSRESRHYPNVLALWLGNEINTLSTSDLLLIETNIDDMSAELLGYVQEQLFEIGALDVWFTPIQMKKNRPATMLSVLAPRNLESKVASLILQETTTLGVRSSTVRRYEAERKIVNLQTSLGSVTAKVKYLDDIATAVSPEYEDCRRIASERKMTLQEVYRIVQNEASDSLLSN